jgi:hypothetical protein
VPAGFPEACELVSELTRHLVDLNEQDQRFALSLLGHFAGRSDLSAAQWFWARKLVSKAQSGPSAGVVVLALCHNRKLVAEAAAGLAARPTGSERADYLGDLAALHLANLRATGLPLTAARRAVRDLVLAAEELNATKAKGGSAA